jgi:hypothetical protein
MCVVIYVCVDGMVMSVRNSNHGRVRLTEFDVFHFYWRTPSHLKMHVYSFC